MITHSIIRYWLWLIQIPSKVKVSRALQIAIGFLIVSATITVLSVVNRDALLHGLEAIAAFVKEHGLLGALMMFALIVLVSFPPLVGYSALLTLNGFIFGIPLGFLLNYFSALVGATLCFITSRMMRQWWLRRSIRDNRISRNYNLLNDDVQQSTHATTDSHVINVNVDDVNGQASGTNLGRSSLAARSIHTSPVESRVIDGVTSSPYYPVSSSGPNSSSSGGGTTATERPEQDGFFSSGGNRRDMFRLLSRYLSLHRNETLKLLLMLRLAPYPFNILNVTMAHIPAIRLKDYLLSTALGLLKVILHTITGNMLVDLKDIFTKPGDGTVSREQIVDLVILGIAVLFGIVSSIYLYRMIQRALAEGADEEIGLS